MGRNGSYQFPEKLIPLTILNGLEGKELPVYSRGEKVRDWLFVGDHAGALLTALEDGVPGETYVFIGSNERWNINVARAICRLVDELSPDEAIRPRDGLIRFVQDRPVHDHRYAIDASVARTTLGRTSRRSFESGLRDTVAWYLDNRQWWERVRSGAYLGERLGLGALV